MDIKINKHRKLPKYFQNTDTYEIFVTTPHMSSIVDTPKRIEKIQSAAYIFDSIKEDGFCLGEEDNYIEMNIDREEENEYENCGHFPAFIIWKFKLVKPMHIYKHVFKYLYIFSV